MVEIPGDHVVGFSHTPHSKTLAPRTGGTLGPPVLGYRTVHTGLPRYFWGADKWGVILPMEVANDLRTFVLINTRKSDEGANAVVNWTAIDGSASHDFKPVPITDPGNDQPLEFTADEIERFIGKKVKISYTIVLNGNETGSPVLEAEVVPELKYPRAIVEGLIGNVLPISDYPSGLTTSVPLIENLREYNASSLRWTVTINSEQIFQHVETVPAPRPTEPFIFMIPPHAYMPYAGCTCSVQYIIWLGAEGDPDLQWNTRPVQFALN